MNIIKIGDEYVNLDNVTSISVRDRQVLVRVGDFHYYISDYHTNEIRKVLDHFSKLTEENSNET